MRDRFPEIFQLGFEEKFQLVQELWDDIAENHADEIPIPDELIAELERRRAKYLQNPTNVLTWEEVEARIRSRHALRTDDPA
jgi:putative addiction module component (TIGR02574 family)